MRKRKLFICVLAVVLLSLTGCEASLSMPAQSGAEEKGDVYFYDELTGKVLSDLSDRFDFKIEQWQLHTEKETGEERLLFSVSIKNKTKTSLKHFNCEVLLDETALYLLTTGLTVYDQNQPVDLIPEVTANGVSYAFDLSVNTDEEIKKLGADKTDLLEKVRNITLKMSWDGGKETVLMDCGQLEIADE